jgi:leucyl-tRNA synthetase
LDKTEFKNVNAGNLYRRVEYFTKRITDDIERMQFNTGVAGLMELLNDMDDYENKDSMEFQYVLYKFNLLLAPFAPMLAEEIYHWWKWVADNESIFLCEWPEYNKNALEQNTTTIVIQINGKFRDKLVLPVNKEKDFVFSEVQKLPKIKKYLHNQQIKKVIYVRNKILNIVI